MRCRACVCSGERRFGITRRPRGAHAGAELDLLVTRRGKRYGFDLGLEHCWIVYPGHEAYSLDERISVLPVAGVPALAASLG